MGRRFHLAALATVVVLGVGLGTGDAGASRPARGAHAAVFAARFSAADGPDLQLTAPANGATIADDDARDPGTHLDHGSHAIAAENVGQRGLGRILVLG